MKKKSLSLFLALLFLASAFITPNTVYAEKLPKMTGKIFFHSYSDYDAQDSQIYMYDFGNKSLKCISKNWKNVKNAMNVSIRPDGKAIVFMGQTATGEWDIFEYKLSNSKPTNLTKGNNRDDEDPKYDCTGKRIIFKQTNKTGEGTGIVQYTFSTKKFRKLISGTTEKSMPYFSDDGKKIFYVDGTGKKMKLMVATKKQNGYKSEELYKKKDIQCYYPIVKGSNVYFSRWYSADNQADQIYLYNTKNNKCKRLSFNSKNYDSSDACVISDRYMIVSSTKSGSKGGYDLFVADLETGKMTNLSSYYSKLNTVNNELGCAYINK